MKALTCFLLLFMMAACAKQDAFLDIKSNKADIRPSTLTDYQAILDNDPVLNAAVPSLGLLSSDHVYLEYTTWQASGTAQERNAYLGASNRHQGENGLDWQWG